MKKKYVKAIILLTALIIFPLFLHTAIGQPPPPPPQDIPIDGGLLTLLLAGLAYGGRKIYLDEKKKRAKDTN